MISGWVIRSAVWLSSSQGIECQRREPRISYTLVRAAIHAHRGDQIVPPRKKITLSEDAREALLSDVELTHEMAAQAVENDKIKIYLAGEQGLTTYELGERLGVSAQTASTWAKQGREALKRREEARGRRGGVDPDRPAELGAVG